MERLDTKALLLRSAELLFVERGIDSVSLLEINRHAGQRNASSLHYHFSSRTNLLEALVDWRMPPLDKRRLELVEICRLGPAEEKLRKLAEAIAMPLIETMTISNPPNNWVRLQARIYQLDSFKFGAYFHSRGYDKGLLEVRKVQQELAPEISQLIRDQRLMFTTRLVVNSLADWQRGVLPLQSGVGVDDLQVFAGNLIDCTQAIIGAESVPFKLPDSTI
jgi:AcrR family transcriptional regulator